MTILKEKVISVNYPCDMDYVDYSKKVLKDLLGKTKKKRKYARHNVIETKKHRARTLFKNIFRTHFFKKYLFIFERKYLKSVYIKLTSYDICSY